MGGFVKAVFDPAGVMGNWEDTPGSPPPQDDNIPSVWQRPGGFIGGMMEPIYAAKKQAESHLRMGDAADKAAQSPGGATLGAFDPNAKVKPADWSAQWQYSPGKGPQWVEPQRVSSDNSVPWAAQVNNGPVKGNRF